MFVEEAIWIARRIATILHKVNTVLDVGSSTYIYRTVDQPHVGALFRLLKSLGKRVYYMDIKDGEGVDIVCDVTDRQCIENILRDYGSFDLVIAANLLEHVKDIKATIENLSKLTSKFLIITVPRIYFYHPDPIDNLFRPKCEKLKEVLMKYGFAPVCCEEIRIRYPYLRKRLIYALATINLILQGQSQPAIINFKALFSKWIQTCALFVKVV